MQNYQHHFISYSLECGVLKFGNFLLKSGRSSPYFFNTGLFDTGQKLRKLGEFYAEALLHSGLSFDGLYGPAYKGIPLVSSTAMAYGQLTDKDVPFSFNRKEAKDHGEGGLIVGATLQGRVLIVDDVITAGTSVRESVDIIKSENATPVGVLCALDRQEKGQGRCSTNQEISEQFGIPVIAIISLKNIIDYLTIEGSCELENLSAYQACYGADELLSEIKANTVINSF